MNLTFTEEEDAFRQEVRAWMQEAMPEELRRAAQGAGGLNFEESVEWHKLLYAKGWIAPHWPKELGGTGWDATRRFIFNEELEMVGALRISVLGLSMVGPLIMQFGTEAQKQRFLPKILRGEEFWCQGYSEPNAGSDLASLRMTAEDAGDHFIVNGQKTWTSWAQNADWIFCLVRTDPAAAKKQNGITFLLVDLKTPGVDVKPMLTLGHAPAFCDTFFDNVKVPKENIVGGLNQGWTVAKALLGRERTLLALIGPSRHVLHKVKRIASTKTVNGRPMLEDPRWRAKIARLEMRFRAHLMVSYRALSDQQKGKMPGPEASILKLVGTKLIQELTELAMEVMGESSLTWYNEGVCAPIEESIGPYFCYERSATIYGGSNEIQRNVIAKMILQLPSR
ncbi:MAG: acyl-CoA dehydrogenase family protein [Deltaproteobacteria bacterium]|nr:acyl-CoA dehydrogenase family protein [Deltaproteobacteria bacterium]MBW1905444.1 acyl-CoA dehydrogenase family protein [Deltaproteobacteria bacterium]MBW2629081.1 acyl-CoA dehydrogenase family protein [Deltaproteobacteria bacterium]